MNVTTLEALVRVVRARLQRGRPIPLLVLRAAHQRPIDAPALAAFVRAAGRVVRASDPIAYSARDPHFAIALIAPGRSGRAVSPGDARATLERLAAAMARDTGDAFERGWSPLAHPRDLHDLRGVLADALARGRRERERRAVLATVGHEFRTPLTAIRGYVETLLEDDLDPATSRRFLQTVQRETLRLGRLVEGMLEFSLLDLSGSSSAVCDGAEVAAAAADALMPLARERGVRIDRDLAGPVRLRVDADACTHAVLNLLENAVKHGRLGGRVLLACATEGAFGRIDVHDDGPGIDGRESRSIFAFGARGGGAGERPGYGIGLAVVAAIVTRSGGEARAGRSPLGGAHFRLTFPLARAESRAATS